MRERAADPALRPPLVHLSPLPPMRNGIADYAAAILKRLAPHYQLICVVDDPAAVDPELYRIAEILSFDDYHRVADRLAGVRHLAHIGNNPDHARILDVLTATPGVVVLHDLTLLYLLECWAGLACGDPRRLVDVVRMLHGGTAAGLAEFKFTTPAPLVSLYSEVTCLELMSDIATAVISHSYHGAVMLRAAGFERDIAVIPHFAEIPAPRQQARQRTDWRERLGVTGDCVLIASLGFVSPNKIIDVALQALALLPAGTGDWRYVIAGEDRDPKVRATVERLKLSDRVIFLDYLDEADFDGVLAASDLLINLRFPTSGETSGTVCRGLAHGLPCVLSDHGWYAELPDDATYKVTAGRDITAELSRVLLIALLDGNDRAARGARAAAYAAETLDLDQIAEDYRAEIEDAWASHGAGLARRPAPPGLVLQPPPAVDTTRGSRGTDATLAALVAAERVSVDGVESRMRALGCGVALDLPGGGAGVVQLCAALSHDDLAAPLLNAVADAWERLAPGEFLTLALIAAAPPALVDPARTTPLAPDFPPGLDLGDLLRRVLGESGFELIRLQETATVPGDGAGACDRIAVATARKAARVRPDPVFFAPVP